MNEKKRILIPKIYQTNKKLKTPISQMKKKNSLTTRKQKSVETHFPATLSEVVLLNLEPQKRTNHHQKDRKFNAQTRRSRVRAPIRISAFRRRRPLPNNFRLLHWLLQRHVGPVLAVDGVVEHFGDAVDCEGGGGVEVRHSDRRAVDGEVGR